MVNGEMCMEKFINDIKTFFFNLPVLAKIAIVACLSICLVVVFTKLIKVATKDKVKIKLSTLLLALILVGLIVLISIWSF